MAKERYGYNGEQALGMLFWHKHDLERAVLDLANFTPFPDEWSVEDKVLFEQAFLFHGKSFHRIRQMVRAAAVRYVFIQVCDTSFALYIATGQVYCQPGQVLLLVEKVPQSHQRHGSTGEAQV